MSIKRSNIGVITCGAAISPELLELLESCEDFILFGHMEELVGLTCEIGRRCLCNY